MCGVYEDVAFEVESCSGVKIEFVELVFDFADVGVGEDMILSRWVLLYEDPVW